MSTDDAHPDAEVEPLDADRPAEQDEQPEAVPDPEEPAALHTDSEEHLQDPDAELSDTLAPDSFSMKTFNPIRVN